MKTIDQGTWSNLFAYILPDLDCRIQNETAAEALTRYRAQCQITLGRWMAAREAEAAARQEEQE